MNVRDDINQYLTGWYHRSKRRQERKGVQYDLSYADFLDLWGQRRINTITKWMDDGTLYRKMGFDFGYVCTWRSYAASQAKVFNKDTAQICTRKVSEVLCRVKKGDTLPPEARANIAKARTGTKHTDSTKQKISTKLTGIKRGPMSDEQKALRSLRNKEAWARKRAAQGGAA